MAVVHTECLCPMDSRLTALAKTNNNLSALFFLMSAGLFRGNTVNLGACLCSELQILATMNNNIAAFFTWLSANGGATVDPSIHSWSDLAGVATLSVGVGAIKIWVNDADLSVKIVQLRTGTDATDTSSGIQRPNDYADPGNAKVWYQA